MIGPETVIKHEIDQKLANTADAVIKFVAGENIETGWGEYGKSWSAEFDHTGNKYKRVNKDPKEFETGRSRKHIIGKAAHEGGHVAWTRMKYYMEFWKQKGGDFIANAWLDGKNNSTVMTNVPGTRDDIMKYLGDDLSPGGNLDREGLQQSAKEDLGYIPSYVKAGGEMLDYWYRRITGSIEDPGAQNYQKQLDSFLGEIKDENARKVLQETIPDFEEFYHDSPTSRIEEETQKNEKKGAEIFRRSWPKYKELIDKSYKDHPVAKMLQQMLQQMSEQQQEGKDGQPQPQAQVGSGGQPQDQQEKGEASGKSQDQEQGQEKSQSPGSKADEVKPSGQMITIPFSELPSEVQKEILEKLQEEMQENQQGQPGKDADEDAGEPKNQPNPWSKLSEKSKQALRKKFKEEMKKLSKEEQKEIMDEATKELEDYEDKTNQKLHFKNDYDGKESNQERREREQQESEKRKEKEDAKQAEKHLKQVDKQIKDVADKLERNYYHESRIKPEVRRIINSVKRSLSKIFRLNDDPGVSYDETGLEFEIEKVFEHVADKKVTQLFKETGEYRSKNYRFTLLIDLSGSMLDNDKINKIFDSVVIFSEIMKSVGIEYEIIGFAETLHQELDDLARYVTVYKGFEEPLTGKTMFKIAHVITDCKQNQGTPTAEATVASWLLTKRRNQEKYSPFNSIITLTDGDSTTYGEDGSPPHQHMRDTFKKLREKDKDIIMQGLGIGQGTDFVNDTYPKLPLITRKKIARLLNTDEDRVGNSFDSLEIFMKAFAIIINDMIYYPDEYKKIK